MHILKHFKCPVRLKYSSSYLAMNKWWCYEMFPDHSRGKGSQEWMAAVTDWIEDTNSPSGLGAQPPVTPLQHQQEIIQFHPHAIRRSPGWWSILWESRENRSYLELHLLGLLCLSITSQTADTLRHLAETLASACHINSREKPSPNRDLILPLNLPISYLRIVNI